jgi:hypothetical protein
MSPRAERRVVWRHGRSPAAAVARSGLRRPSRPRCRTPVGRSHDDRHPRGTREGSHRTNYRSRSRRIAAPGTPRAAERPSRRVAAQDLLHAWSRCAPDSTTSPRKPSIDRHRPFRRAEVSISPTVVRVLFYSGSQTLSRHPRGATNFPWRLVRRFSAPSARSADPAARSSRKNRRPGRAAARAGTRTALPLILGSGRQGPAMRWTATTRSTGGRRLGVPEAWRLRSRSGASRTSCSPGVSAARPGSPEGCRGRSGPARQTSRGPRRARRPREGIQHEGTLTEGCDPRR